MEIPFDQICLSPQQKEYLAQLAERTGRPWHEVLEEALASFEQATLREAPANGESVYDALKRLGLLGSVEDAPSDLSTNPTYMEGFGERAG